MGRYKLEPLNDTDIHFFDNLTQLTYQKGRGDGNPSRLYDLSNKLTITTNKYHNNIVLEIWYNNPKGEEEVKLFTGSKIDDHVDGWCYYGKWIHVGPWISDINELIKKEFEDHNLRSVKTQQDEKYQKEVKILKKYNS